MQLVHILFNVDLILSHITTFLVLNLPKILSSSQIFKSLPSSSAPNTLKLQGRNLRFNHQVSFFVRYIWALIIKVCGNSPINFIHPLDTKISQ